MAQGYVSVDEIEQEAAASGEDACHLCQHPMIVHGINEIAKKIAPLRGRRQNQPWGAA